MIKIKDEAADAAYALGWSAVKRMPEPMARRMFTAIADRTWRKRGTGVLQLEKNIGRVLGRPADSPAVREVSREAVRSYMRYWMESFRLPVMPRERIRAGMNVTGDQAIYDAIGKGRGVVVALPHMGNYDHAGAWLGTQGYPITTVAERLKPESLYNRFTAYRESLGFEILPLTGGASSFGIMARRLREPKVICLVADRDLSETGVDVEFFGRTARMPGGPAALAIQTGAALLPVTLWFEGDGWGARVHEEVPQPSEGTRKEKTRAMTQALADAFAEGIAAHPADWHMMQKIWVEDLS
ncbi:phosphatidylinositol mannoside acyltransferase [Actinocorallia sp. A-T 12471]|uniref:phosphatidylinositol mannoside acyltransferase n=1 Tax=Actinocorallia sp. A-T 12471 TaxID=3089813 RepID=UPI0029D2E066|nr:phosphatidylinositol mannoside acyltransferase [Actinocorallia sp. A-T 12471]MDX6740317.1 phosphatidylinositol mannoside acyltransferase [Actinocorallia sp. A-T 12471]